VIAIKALRGGDVSEGMPFSATHQHFSPLRALADVFEHCDLAIDGAFHPLIFLDRFVLFLQLCGWHGEM